MSTSFTRRDMLKASGALAAGSLAIGSLAVADEAPAADGASFDVRRRAAELNPQEPLATMANTQVPNIFTPWKMGSLELPNRIVKSAAGYIGVTSLGIDSPLFLDYLASLAKGGVALLYTDDFAELYDHFKAIPDVGKIVDWTPEQLAAIAETVHVNGGKIGYQLATMGLVYSGFEPDPTAMFQTSTCMDMTPEEIQDLIADTIKAAKTLQDAGFDCVEINAAGENTGQTFMSRARNKRDDEYGPQTIENRCRFVCEIVRGIKETCGADFPVQVLINGIEENDKLIGDSELFTTVEDNKEICKLLEEAGADSLHIRIGPCGQHVAEFAGDLFFTGYGIEGTTSYGTQFDFKRHWQGKLKADQSGLGVMTNVAAELKQAVSIPVGCVTYMDPARDPEFFDGLIESGAIDFMLMNRPLNVDTEYVNKLADGRLDEIRPCTRCMHCHWDANPDGSLKFGCRTLAAHPFRQATGQITGSYEPEPATEPKKVMVVGAGPAGMEAAVVAAQRGHEVTLYEKMGYLGGLLPFAAHVKGEHENLDVLNAYYARQLELLGVDVQTGVEVDAALVGEVAPDAVVWAVGATRDTLGLVSTAGTKVLGIDQVVGAEIADEVVIAGSNAQAVDLAMYLLAQGKHVSIVTPSDGSTTGHGHSYWVKTYTQPMLKALGCRLWTNASIAEVGEGTLTVRTSYGTNVEIACGALIEALDGLPTPIPEGLACDVHAVGDCNVPFNISEAILAGNQAARLI